jgi:hypothetical protein
MKHAGLTIGFTDTGALAVRCPWRNEHTTSTNGVDTSSVILPPTGEWRWGIFKCLHDHCRYRTTLDLLGVLDPKALEVARKEHGAGLVRTKVHAGWVQHLDARDELEELDRICLRCYPRGGAAPILVSVQVESPAHVGGLEGFPIEHLMGRYIDLAIRGDKVTWMRLVN